MQITHDFLKIFGEIYNLYTVFDFGAAKRICCHPEYVGFSIVF